MARVELSALIPWCRALKHGLDIGLSPVKVLRQQARIGPGSLRAASERMAEHVEKGESLTDAIAESGVGLPSLFREIVTMAEQAGRLPDALGELERHYEAVLRARKQFRTALIWPAISYVLAIGVIALLIFILGMLGTNNPIGFGLSGMSGAITVLVLGYGAAIAAVLAYRTAMASDDVQGAFQAVAIHIPGLAGCARAVALSRLTMSYHMMAEAGMPADKVIKASLRATTNKAYSGIADAVAKEVRRGEEVSEVLGPYGERLFPADFMQVVALGEETGNLAELMHKQSKHYADEAARKMSFLAKLAGGVVYAMIAVFIIVMIMNILMGPVSQPYRDAFDAVDNPEKWLRGGK